MQLQKTTLTFFYRLARLLAPLTEYSELAAISALVFAPFEVEIRRFAVLEKSMLAKCIGALASKSHNGQLEVGEGVGVEPLGRHLTTMGNIKRTALLQNYPNPFNPETWIPYHLARDSSVTLIIYDQSGHIVRFLNIGHQVSGIYRDKANAAYWDGCNQNGEPVTSGTYYYQLRAGDYTALRRMVIVK